MERDALKSRSFLLFFKHITPTGYSQKNEEDRKISQDEEEEKSEKHGATNM